jgi:hypothetical protein
MIEQRIEKHGDSSSIVRLLTAVTVATILGVSPKTIHKLAREKKLACVQVTSRDRRFIREQRRQGCRHWQNTDSGQRYHE